MLTKEQFASIFPSITATLREDYYQALSDAMAEFQINTLQRIAAFLAQIGHETAGLHYMEELGGPDYFKRYDGRVDLGNVNPGDGDRYHGRGMIQLTGRVNYREYGALLDLDLEENPEQASKTPANARIAGCYWYRKSCNELADADRFERITRRINGGLNGIQDRKSRWDKCRRILGLPIILGVTP